MSGTCRVCVFFVYASNGCTSVFVYACFGYVCIYIVFLTVYVFRRIHFYSIMQ